MIDMVGYPDTKNAYFEQQIPFSSKYSPPDLRDREARHMLIADVDSSRNVSYSEEHLSQFGMSSMSSQPGGNRCLPG